MKSVPLLNPEEEARHLLELFGGVQADCIRFLHDQFNVIQARGQFLLSLGTLTLTITGFSGPKIAQTNLFSRYSIAVGITLVLVSMMVLLLGSNRIRWVSQARAATPEATLVAIIRYRHQKTQFYLIELYLLVAGLSLYVASVVSFLIFYQG